VLIYFYLFAVIVGGVLLGASILLGGDHDSDADADLDAHADFGAHGDLDIDADGDVSADHDMDLDHDAGEGAHGDGGVAHGGLDYFLWSFKSVRFWTFFLAFFGLTGLALDGLGLVSSWPIALGLAIAMGALSGLGATAAIRMLASDESGAVASSSDYVGKTVRVIVPVEKDGTGKVRLQLKGNTVDVLATTDEAESFASRDEAMIIEMDGTKARIARVNDE
jgi:membrane protein implicated in regulation of membrane protease activity